MKKNNYWETKEQLISDINHNNLYVNMLSEEMKVMPIAIILLFGQKISVLIKLLQENAANIIVIKLTQNVVYVVYYARVKKILMKKKSKDGINLLKMLVPVLIKSLKYIIAVVFIPHIYAVTYFQYVCL